MLLDDSIPCHLTSYSFLFCFEMSASLVKMSSNIDLIYIRVVHFRNSVPFEFVPFYKFIVSWQFIFPTQKTQNCFSSNLICTLSYLTMHVIVALSTAHNCFPHKTLSMAPFNHI